jgi:hypothetical protein
MRRLGMSDAEIARARGRTIEEVTPKAKPTLASIDAEIDELRALRKSARQKYWSREVQEREAALYAQRDELQAEERGEDDPSEKDTNAVGLDETSLPEALREEWAKSGPNGIEDALSAIRTRTTILEDLEDGGDGLRSSFDELPDDAQVAVAAGLATDSGKWPAASEQEVREFGEVPHGAELLKEWGSDAPRLLGRARREADHIMSRMTERSRLQMHHWIAGRSSAELRATIMALATRATRRL